MHRQSFVITVPTYGVREGGDPTRRSHRTITGHRQVTIAIEVDMEGIAFDLGPRAARSKRRRATGLSSRVIVRASK